MQKGAKSIFLIDKKRTYFAAKNEEGKSGIGLWVVDKCTENIPQMAKWDIPNDGLGHRGHE